MDSQNYFNKDFNLQAKISKTSEDIQHAEIILRDPQNEIHFTISIRLQREKEVTQKPYDILWIQILQNDKLAGNLKMNIGKNNLTNSILSQFEKLQNQFLDLDSSEEMKKNLFIFLLSLVITLYYIQSNILIKNFFTHVYEINIFLNKLIGEISKENFNLSEINFSKEFLAEQIDLIRKRIFDDIKFFPKF